MSYIYQVGKKKRGKLGVLVWAKNRAEAKKWLSPKGKRCKLYCLGKA